MRTSSFSISGLHPDAVSIATFPARWLPFKGRKYIALAPTKALLKDWQYRLISEEEYTERFYQEKLSKTIPEKVLKDLGESAILLCYEKPGQFCHRRIVAGWLEEALGISVPEVS